MEVSRLRATRTGLTGASCARRSVGRGCCRGGAAIHRFAWPLRRAVISVTTVHRDVAARPVAEIIGARIAVVAVFEALAFGHVPCATLPPTPPEPPCHPLPAFTTATATVALGLTAAGDRDNEKTEQTHPARHDALHISIRQHDTFSFAESLRLPADNARFVPTKSPGDFAIAPRSKAPIVDGRQQSLSASDNEAPAAGATRSRRNHGLDTERDEGRRSRLSRRPREPRNCRS